MGRPLFPGQLVSEGFGLYQMSGVLADFFEHLSRPETDGDSRWIESWPNGLVDACEAKARAHRIFTRLGIAAPPKSAEAIRLHVDAVAAIDGAETRLAHELVLWGRTLADRDPEDDPPDPQLPQYTAILFRIVGAYSTFLVRDDDGDTFIRRAGAPDGVCTCLSRLPDLLGDAGISIWNGDAVAGSRLDDLSVGLRNLTDRLSEWRAGWLKRCQAEPTV